MESKELLAERDIKWCPMPARDVCYEAVYSHESRQRCAWWIPGAECCAIVHIARKLNDLAASVWIEIEKKEPFEPDNLF